MTDTKKFRKGQQVVGLHRGGQAWSPQPIGTVTQVRAGWVRVAWHGTCVEDDMKPEWLVKKDYSESYGADLAAAQRREARR